MVCSTVILIGFIRLLIKELKAVFHCVLQMCLWDLQYDVGFDNSCRRHLSITVQRHTKLQSENVAGKIRFGNVESDKSVIQKPS